MIAALAPPYGIQVLTSLRELETQLRTSRPRACLLDIFNSPKSVTLPTLRRFRGRNPSMALVIASDFSGREMELYHLGRLSVDGVIRLEDRPDRRQIRAAVDRAMASSLAKKVILKADGTLPPMAQGIIRWSIEHAEARPQVSDLAAALAMSPRVLRKETNTLGLPSPRAFLLWGRLVRATDLLERPTETVERVALHLGYGTGGALGKAFRRHIGMSPTALLEKGGLNRTLEAFFKGGGFSQESIRLHGGTEENDTEK